MLPLLCKELEVPKMMNLINIYIKHEDHPELDNHLFCLFSWSANKIYTSFEDELIKHKLFEFHKDVSSQHFIVCFKVGKEMQDNYDSFKKGKYSQITQSGKEQIIKFYNIGKDHAVYMVMYKDPRLKKQLEKVLDTKISDLSELSSILDFDRETYSSSYIVEGQSPLPQLVRY
jgi:hypothetical protein